MKDIMVNNKELLNNLEANKKSISDQSHKIEGHAPPRHLEIYDTARAQLDTAPPEAAGFIASSISKAIKHDNPSHIDQAVILCHQHAINFPQILQDLIAEVAMLRLYKVKPEWNKPKLQTSAFKDGVTEQTYLWILKLTLFCEMDLVPAANLAAARRGRDFPLQQLKSSVLQKYYSKWLKTDATQALILTLNKQYPSGWRKPDQENFIANFPQKLPAALEGTRR